MKYFKINNKFIMIFFKNGYQLLDILDINKKAAYDY